MLAPLLLALATASTGAAPDVAKFVVLSTRAERSTEKELAGTVTELVLASLAKGRGVQVMGESDVVPFLDDAAQKQLRSCDDDAACLVEIGGVLGADYLVSVSLGSLGRNYLVSARLLDAKKGQVVQRASRTVERTEDALAEAICPLVQGLLRGLSLRDPRVSTTDGACGEAPKPLDSPKIRVEAPAAPPAAVKAVEEPAQPVPSRPSRAPSASSAVHLGLRAGYTPVAGSLGVSLRTPDPEA